MSYVRLYCFCWKLLLTLLVCHLICWKLILHSLQCYNVGFWILCTLDLLTVQVSNCYLYLTPISNLCVGYDAPIDFNPGILPHLLATSQHHVERILAIFSRQYNLPTHVDSTTSERRQALDLSLLNEVLPQLDIHLMAVTPMERHFGQLCYVNHPNALHPQCTGSLSAVTP